MHRWNQLLVGRAQASASACSQHTRNALYRDSFSPSRAANAHGHVFCHGIILQHVFPSQLMRTSCNHASTAFRGSSWTAFRGTLEVLSWRYPPIESSESHILLYMHFFIFSFLVSFAIYILYISLCNSFFTCPI
jgi:hypothetical protein